MSFYDGTKLLSLKDLNGDTPEIYMCTSNRSAGKTTYFSRLIVNRYKRGQGKFMLLYRFNYELTEVADKFFKDIKTLFFPNDEMTSKSRMKGIYHDLYINDEHCGYAVAINCADQIKKNSHLFSDTACMFMDEFQSETNHYCPHEVDKFISIHQSVARGQGEQSRYVPVFMCANPVTLLNPYYTEMDISSRLIPDVKFLRGVGFVLEQGYVESASEAQQQSAFNRAFFKNKYVAYASEALYLNDNHAFIEKMSGKSAYVCTLKYKGKSYAIREYINAGVIYCDTRADESFPFKITVTTDDHEINYVMLKRCDTFLTSMRQLFEKGCFRFKDLSCKEAVLKALSY